MIRLQRSVPLFRISVAPWYWHGDNAGIVLPSVSFALPYVVFILLVADANAGRRRSRMVNAPEKNVRSRRPHDGGPLCPPEKGGEFCRSRRRDGCTRCVGVGPYVQRSTRYPPRAGSHVLAGSRGGGPRRVETFRSYSTSPPIDAYAGKGGHWGSSSGGSRPIDGALRPARTNCSGCPV